MYQLKSSSEPHCWILLYFIEVIIHPTGDTSKAQLGYDSRRQSLMFTVVNEGFGNAEACPKWQRLKAAVGGRLLDARMGARQQKPMFTFVNEDFAHAQDTAKCQRRESSFGVQVKAPKPEVYWCK